MDSYLAGQEILLLWHPKLYYHVHKGSPYEPILRQFSSCHISDPVFLRLIFSVILFKVVSSLDILQPIFCMYILFFFCVTYASRLILHNLIKVTVLGEEYES